ncbi:MAG: glycosyltransferase, partial [Spirochaetales bacterium]|nr:glycosyltransferase [Spirochaetales bacterium]
FEVVVVNDGSTDDTLNTLIRHFNLEKTDAAFAKELKTRPISGIYRNRRIPGLTVVDKMNGGKADSLNAGINIAKGEYVLGIDADSILERNSLLHLTSIFLSEKEAPIAAGGNILPVNGCEVRDGVISKMEVPRNAVALAQTTEYLRAFMSGRLGWSKLNTLMIISGAFGLFRRSHLVELNGYLTASEKYEKDTVGEDMELVVRMARREKEAKRKGRIVYNFHAHCWTEVPEKLSILKRQRVRWQRGLIDILFYHSRMMFNPAFGTYGLLGFPYFLIVEVIGPWLEALGLVAFFGGIVLGVLPRDLILAFLAANCLLGFSVTAFSLYTSNTWKTLYSFKDRMKLYLMSVFETAGLRQLFSIYRLSGLVSALRKQHGWGAMPRTGFAKQKKKGNA